MEGRADLEEPVAMDSRKWPWADGAAAGPGGGPGGRGGGFGGADLAAAADAAARWARVPAAATGRLRQRPAKPPYALQRQSALSLDNSALDAQPFSLTGQENPKAAYAKFRSSGMFGGPLKIPHLLSGQKTFFTINYQLARPRNASMTTTLVPHGRRAHGDFSQALTPPRAPRSPFTIRWAARLSPTT